VAVGVWDPLCAKNYIFCSVRHIEHEANVLYVSLIVCSVVHLTSENVNSRMESYSLRFCITNLTLMVILNGDMKLLLET